MPRQPVETAVFTALVLAGRRGPTDPLAQKAGCSHKVLIQIGGLPMLIHVVRSLRAVRHVGKLVISIDDPVKLADLSEVWDLVSSGVLSFHTSGNSPSASVHEYLRVLPAKELLLVTTADHPLLTPDALEFFCSAVLNNDADVTV